MALINATISRIINGAAELSAGNTNNIKIPIKYLPKKCQVGDLVMIETLTSEQYHNRQRDIAKALLSEILGDHGA